MNFSIYALPTREVMAYRLESLISRFFYPSEQVRGKGKLPPEASLYRASPKDQMSRAGVKKVF
jgi:hypothetical protein